jgi:hypothetical protein
LNECQDPVSSRRKKKLRKISRIDERQQSLLLKQMSKTLEKVVVRHLLVLPEEASWLPYKVVVEAVVVEGGSWTLSEAVEEEDHQVVEEEDCLVILQAEAVVVEEDSWTLSGAGEEEDHQAVVEEDSWTLSRAAEEEDHQAVVEEDSWMPSRAVEGEDRQAVVEEDSWMPLRAVEKEGHQEVVEEGSWQQLQRVEVETNALAKLSAHDRMIQLRGRDINILDYIHFIIR